MVRSILRNLGSFKDVSLVTGSHEDVTTFNMNTMFRAHLYVLIMERPPRRKQPFLGTLYIYDIISIHTSAEQGHSEV